MAKKNSKAFVSHHFRCIHFFTKMYKFFFRFFNLSNIDGKCIIANIIFTYIFNSYNLEHTIFEYQCCSSPADIR